VASEVPGECVDVDRNGLSGPHELKLRFPKISRDPSGLLRFGRVMLARTASVPRLTVGARLYFTHVARPLLLLAQASLIVTKLPDLLAESRILFFCHRFLSTSNCIIQLLRTLASVSGGDRSLFGDGVTDKKDDRHTEKADERNVPEVVNIGIRHRLLVQPSFDKRVATNLAQPRTDVVRHHHLVHSQGSLDFAAGTDFLLNVETPCSGLKPGATTDDVPGYDRRYAG